MSEKPLPAVRLAAEEGRTGRTYRFREHTIAPDTQPDAEAWLFFFECQVCQDTGPRKDSPDDALDWTLEHLKQNPEHLSYREHITRPYRAVPGRWL